MGVKLQSALGGSVELNAPSTATNYTLAVPAVNGTLALTSQVTGGFKNKIINGDFQVWQRATSQSTGGFGSADRMAFYWSTGSLTAARGQSDTPIVDSVTGTYVLLTATSLTGGYISHSIEDVRTFNGQTVTYSYYYNLISGNDIGEGSSYLRQNFGVGGSATVDTQPISNTTTLISGTVYRRTMVFNLPSTAGKTFAAGHSLTIIHAINGTFQKTLWNLQLEAGPVATSFEARPYGVELMLCQRYYYKMLNSLWMCRYATGGYSVVTVPLPTTMRAFPTITQTNNQSFNTYSSSYTGNAVALIYQLEPGNGFELTSLTASSEL